MLKLFIIFMYEVSNKNTVSHNFIHFIVISMFGCKRWVNVCFSGGLMQRRDKRIIYLESLLLLFFVRGGAISFIFIFLQAHSPIRFRESEIHNLLSPHPPQTSHTHWTVLLLISILHRWSLICCSIVLLLGYHIL